MSTRDLRIDSLRPLLSPAILLEEIPASDKAESTVQSGRQEISALLAGSDDRLLVVTGPCSIHDPLAGIDYAERLKAQIRKHEKDLRIVMRVYFEKPRTTVGWKGLINDPGLDDSYEINRGLRMARAFLRDVCELGVPCGAEFLDPISPQFIAGLVSWGAIGARTTESQVHRELASGLSMPIGFKNGTQGTIQIAVDAVKSSAHPHRFLGVTEQGLAAIVVTTGNPDCHLILRGGTDGPNYSAEHVTAAIARLEGANLPPRLLIDCSHGNSHKDHEKQPAVVSDVCAQLSDGQVAIMGVMLESFLEPGRQGLGDPKTLKYGQSITDACMGWDTTVQCLDQLAEAVRKRR